TPTRYVNTASSGGDGTTPATSGAAAAFASTAAAVAAIESEATDFIIHVAGGADPNPVEFDGGTWGDRQITIIVDPGSRMNGVWNASKYHIVTTDARPLNNHATQGVNNLTIVGLAAQMTVTSTGGTQ